MYPKEKWFVKVICLTILLLNACTTQATKTATSPQNSVTPTQISRTNTPTFTTTPSPTFTPTISPTVDVITELASEFNIPSICLFAYQISRDQNWIGADCNTSRELIIAQKGTNNKIAIPYQDILDKNPIAFTVKPLSWSSDSRYFYFTTTTVCCSSYNQYEGNGSLYRYDTEQNFWDILVNAGYEPYYFFSDDGGRFVYINQVNNLYSEIEVGMVEILTNNSKRVVLKGYSVEDRYYAWSKKMDKFAIAIWELQFRNGTPGAVLLKMDFKKMDMEIIKEFNQNNLLAEE